MFLKCNKYIYPSNKMLRIPIIASTVDKQFEYINMTPLYEQIFNTCKLTDLLDREILLREMTYKLEFKHNIAFNDKHYLFTFLPNYDDWFIQVIEKNHIKSPNTTPKNDLTFNLDEYLIICSWNMMLADLFEISTNMMGNSVKELNVQIEQAIQEKKDNVFIKTKNNYMLCVITKISVYYNIKCYNLTNQITAISNKNKTNQIKINIEKLKI